MKAPRARLHAVDITTIESGVYPKGRYADPGDLQAIYDGLAQRFVADDDDGPLVDLIADLAPGHAARLTRLRGEHACHLRSFERLLATQDLSLWELNIELQTLLDAIVQAEQAEAALLQDAWLTDVGEGD